MQAANAYNLDQMRLLTELIAEIETWPPEVRAFEFQYESFGCWRLVVRRNGVRTRFDFDGKERYPAAERLQPDAGDFTKPPKALGVLELPRGLDQESLAAVLQFVRAHIG